MTIQGAVYELERMMLRDDIPDYIKPTIKKVIETVVDEYNEILNKIRAEITEYAMPDFEYHGCGGSQKIVELEDVLQIIDKYRGEAS